MNMKDKSEKPPDDVLSGPGFKMVRRGRHLELTTKRSPEEQRELNRRMQESRPHILAEIESKTTELRQVIHKYTSLDLISNLLVREVMHDPNEYVESESKLRPHWVEHATVIELMDPKYELRQPVLVESEDLERAYALLEEIFTQTMWYYLAEGADPTRSGPPSRIDELRFAALTHGMSVRSPAYSSHWREVLLGLFEDTGNAGIQWLSTSHALDVHSALAVIDGIEKHILGSVNERFQKARTERKNFLQRLNDYKSTGRFKGEAHEKELFDQVRNIRGKKAKHYVNYMFAEWTRVALGTVLSFDPQGIAEISGVALKNVKAFLNEASLEFGISCRDVLPAPVNVLHDRPIVCYANHYFCSVPHLLPWAVKPLFERLLLSGPSWNAYQKHRSSYLVRPAVSHIKTMLPNATTYTDLFYPLESGGEAELDALLLFDRYAFLAEGKAGSLGKARRGGKEKMKTQLEALVGDAADQVVRADNYVRNTDVPAFRLEDGQTVVLDKTRYSEHVLLTVTLDVLDIFTADMYQMRDIGVVTTHDLPWCVALTDLRAISEILVRPFEFTHYLRWRFSAISDPRLHGGKDELNWLAVYLVEGPARPTVPSTFNDLMFTSYTDKFDAYFLYKEGQRTIPASRPSQPLPKPMDSLCDRLAEESPLGFTEPCEGLLDLNFVERAQFVQKLAELAFHEQRGRASQFSFEATFISIFVTGRQLSEEGLKLEAASLKGVSSKKALALSLTSIPRWRVQGWAVA
jgi:hypothetical protein